MRVLTLKAFRSWVGHLPKATTFKKRTIRGCPIATYLGGAVRVGLGAHKFDNVVQPVKNPHWVQQVIRYVDYRGRDEVTRDDLLALLSALSL